MFFNIPSMSSTFFSGIALKLPSGFSSEIPLEILPEVLQRIIFRKSCMDYLRNSPRNSSKVPAANLSETNPGIPLEIPLENNSEISP